MQQNNKISTRKSHSKNHTYKHNNLQETRPDALRIIIQRRKMHYNTIKNKRNQRNTQKRQQDAKYTHVDKNTHSGYIHSRKNTARTTNAIEPTPKYQYKYIIQQEKASETRKIGNAHP